MKQIDTKRDKLHIGFVCNEYPGITANGGIGTFTQTLGEKLVKAGHSVTVFGIYKNIDKKIVKTINGVRIVAVPYLNIPRVDWEFNRWRLMKIIKSEHRRDNLSLLEVPDYHGWLRASRLKIPKVIRIHSPQKVGLDPSVDPMNLPRAIMSEEISIKHADFICAVGESVATAARKTYLNNLKAETEIEIIYNGIDSDYYHPTTEAKNISSMNIVFAGRLTVKKGVIELIKAWKKIVNAFPTAQLIMAGRDEEYGKFRSMQKELESYLSDDIRESVDFKGFLNASEVLQLFQNAIICIFPSHREAFSIVILEAMATGAPVIYSEIGPGHEIIQDGIDGMLCDPHDPGSIAKKVIYLLEDEKLRNNMGSNAREHVVSNFSLTSMVDQNLQYYHYCINQYLLSF